MTDTTRPPLRLGSLRTTRPVDDRPKHVIAEYRHAERRVTCTCGWDGASESPGGGRSDWTRHVEEHRARR